MFHWPTGFIVKVEIQSFQAHKGINILFKRGIKFSGPGNGMGYSRLELKNDEREQERGCSFSRTRKSNLG